MQMGAMKVIVIVTSVKTSPRTTEPKQGARVLEIMITHVMCSEPDVPRRGSNLIIMYHVNISAKRETLFSRLPWALFGHSWRTNSGMGPRA